MYKKKIIKNKQLFFLLIIYTISNIFYYTNNFYINFLKPFFGLIILIIYYQDLKLSKKKEINITLTISIIFFILYLTSGFIFGFNKNHSNYSLINFFINLWKVILPICSIEVIRYKLLRSNKNYFGFRALVTIIIILSEINFKALFLSDNIIFFHYFASIIVPNF